MSDISDQLNKYLTTYKLGRELYNLIKKDKPVLDYIQTLVPDTSYLPEQLYCIINKVSPICKHGKQKKFKDTWAGYYRCGKSSCKCYRESQSEKISKSKKQLSKEDWDDILKKRKETNLKKYGTEFAIQNSDVKLKVENTNLKKYGVKTTLLVPKVQEKIKETLIDRYGIENPMQSPEFKQTAMETCLFKYGHVSYPHSTEGRVRVRTTLKEKYNVASIAQLKFSDEVRELLQDTVRFHKEYREIGIDGLCKQYPELNYEMCKAKLLREGIADVTTYTKPEGFVKTILENHNINFLHNTRKVISPLELDFYCPDQNLAIEVCGLYWHQISIVKDEKYHVNKLEACLAKNIELITVFSDSILEKPSIVENRILSKLKLLPRAIHARNLNIKSDTKRDLLCSFLNDHHIQGTRLGSVNLAALDNNEQVQAVMTFGPNRASLGNKASKANVYEMYRFAVNGNIPGVASKLFKHFVTNFSPELIVSYSDRCWGEGQVYQNLGFEKISVTRPNYWYSQNFITKYHRYSFAKHKLVESGYDPGLTEFQIMEERKYGRIYDCGTVKYVWKKVENN